MENIEVEQIIRDYLNDVVHMSCASVGTDGRPWAWEVHFAFDDDLNLYWVSVPAVRHSQELAANPHIAGTIVKQHALGEVPRGVSFEGTVEVLQDVTAEHPAFKAYTSRFADRTEAVLDGYAHDGPGARRIYKISVSDYYLADTIRTGRPEKHHLAWPSTS